MEAERATKSDGEPSTITQRNTNPYLFATF